MKQPKMRLGLQTKGTAVERWCPESRAALAAG
jgi:hypothetical protein